MAKLVLIEELHLDFLVPRGLPDAAARAISVATATQLVDNRTHPRPRGPRLARPRAPAPAAAGHGGLPPPLGASQPGPGRPLLPISDPRGCDPTTVTPGGPRPEAAPARGPPPSPPAMQVVVLERRTPVGQHSTAGPRGGAAREETTPAQAGGGTPGPAATARF
jgi:hypothetical protein